MKIQEYLAFCFLKGIKPSCGNSLQVYKRYKKYGIPLKYSNVKHIEKAYEINYYLKQNLKRHESNNQD